MKKTYLTTFLCLTTICLFAENYYWIGGSGNWADPMHWSLSDLGTGESAETIPTINDNVYFNEFSFENEGDTVYVSQSDIECQEMDWASIQTRVVLYFRPDANDNKRVNIAGSLLLSPILEIVGDEVTWVFKAGSFNNLLLTAGKTLSHAEFDNEAGNWWLFDQLDVSGTIRHLAGELNTNAKNINCTNFESSGSTPRKLILGTSTLEASNRLELENNNLDLDIGSCNLACSMLKASGFAFNNVTLLLGTDALELLNANTPNLSLEFVLPAGETLNVLGDILVSSICANPVSIVSSVPGTQAFLLSAGNTVEIWHTRLKDIGVSGGDFIAYDSFDSGNNSGWAFKDAPGNCNLTVELSNFTADCKNRNVTLDWTTETEVNSAYFGIETSLNGEDFEEIGRVSAAGNSTIELDYTFLDTELRTNQHYYRLHQVDIFNESEYSEILNVSCLPPPPDIIDIYPNPISDAAVLHLNLPVTNHVRTEIYNSFGQLLISESRDAPKGIHDLNISMLNMLPGVYIVKVYYDGKYMQKKFVKE